MSNTQRVSHWIDLIKQGDLVERLLAHLGVGQLREIAVAKLEGASNAEIAERLACSERTIERRLHLIREKCQQELMVENEHSPGKTADRSPGTD